MEAVREALAQFGSAWNNEVPRALVKLYEPLQAKQNKTYGSDIQVHKAIKYASHERNRLDVYSPATDTDSSARPVVVYFHGGGLVAGDNDVTPNIYANIGNYFTKNGCITVLATYRLALQGGHHPHGAEDVAAALGWVHANIPRYGGDPSHVVAMGQSAGGFHLFTAMTMGYLDKPAGLLRAAVSLSAPFTVGVTDPVRVNAMSAWFQTEPEQVWQINARFSPLALFRQEFFGDVSGKEPRKGFPCEFLMLVGENEADEILEGTWEFVAAYKQRFGRLPILEVLKGHNHVSYGFGLGLEAPEYETVGERLLDFVKNVAIESS